MTALVRSVKALSKLLDELRGLLRQADDLFASVLKGGKGGAGRGLGREGDAVPQVHRFANDDDAVAYGREHWRGLKDELTPEQDAAVRDYTREVPGLSGVTYKDINGALRNGPPYPANLEDHIRAIDETLQKRALTETVEVTRGTGTSHWSFEPGNVDGQIVTEPSYLSTSLGGPAPAFADKDAILHLEVPRGTPAAWVESISEFGGSERELLLGRGLRWEAKSSELIDGQWHVYGEMIP
nr:ADP-ribosyltransferase [Leifsonia naganoensis]